MSEQCEWCSDRPVMKIKAHGNYQRFSCYKHRDKVRCQVRLDGYLADDIDEIELAERPRAKP